MQKSQLKSIKLIGNVIASISLLMVLSNTMGLLMIDHLKGGASNGEGLDYFNHAFTSANSIGIVSLALGVVLLVSGIFIARYKSWARILAQFVAMLFLICTWYVAVFISHKNPIDKGVFSLSQLIGPLLWSIPIIVLIRYLNKGTVKIHFS